jgi:prepilin-type N-terminal cleavage/methylation domain-containing protein
MDPQRSVISREFHRSSRAARRTLNGHFCSHGECKPALRGNRSAALGRCASHPPPGFTLIELVVVIAIIAVLIALLLPAVQSAREAAGRAQCVNNVKQLGLAIHNYESIFGSLPIGRVWTPLTGIPLPGFFEGVQNTNWFTQILPQIEQQPLYNSFNFSIGPEGIYDATGMPSGFSINSTVFGSKVASMKCPSDAWRMLQVTWPTNGRVIVAPRGNYMVSWGNTIWSQADSAGAGATPTRNIPVV